MSKRKAAFTLVELLVVIRIIAVLIGILMPALAKARAAAQETQCMSNLRLWGQGMEMYVDANKGFMPFKPPDGSAKQPFGPAPKPSNAMIASSPNWPVGINDMSLNFNAVPTYVGQQAYYDLLVNAKNGGLPPPTPDNPSFFVCPASQPPNENTENLAAGDFPLSSDGYFQFDAVDSTGVLVGKTGSSYIKANISYCASSNLYDAPVATNAQAAAGYTPTYPINQKMTQLSPASSIAMMVEKIAAPSEYLCSNVQGYIARNAAATGINYHVDANGYTNGIAQLKANWKRFAARHNGGGNILFVDGHVQFYLWSDVQLNVLPNTPGAALPSEPPGGDANRPDLIWNPNGPTN